MTAQVKPLTQIITDELYNLRMWRRMDDDKGVERCNDHINEMLDLIPRTKSTGKVTE